MNWSPQQLPLWLDEAMVALIVVSFVIGLAWWLRLGSLYREIGANGLDTVADHRDTQPDARVQDARQMREAIADHRRRRAPGAH